MPSFPLIAVDVGNSRTKLGYFPSAPLDSELPTPSAMVELSGVAWTTESLRAWLESLGPASAAAGWLVGSVNRAAAERLESAVAEIFPAARTMRLTPRDLPLVVGVPAPDGVGIDRLLGAVAANRVRGAGRAAIVLHVGTAITANLISADGAFVGGAILPGIALSAQALHDYTDLLPRIDMIDLAESPPAVGAATEPAIRSGLFWGAVGAMRELVARMTAAANSEADVLLTGGAAPSVAHLLGEAVRCEPHLVLAGIALAAEHRGKWQAEP
ncbi:MAG: type III pantothenate kinase [Pirellulales bacterium]